MNVRIEQTTTRLLAISWGFSTAVTTKSRCPRWVLGTFAFLFKCQHSNMASPLEQERKYKFIAFSCNKKHQFKVG